jgi:hypothetical protein
LAESSAAERRKTREVFDIVALVDQFADHDCSDDRDRIYALYAMASNIEPVFPQPRSDDVLEVGENETRLEPGSKEVQKGDIVYMNIDYTLDVRDTYRTFAIVCLKDNKLVQLLVATATRSHDRKPDVWLSWLPDWRLKSKSSNCASEALPTSFNWSPVQFTGNISRSRLSLQISKSHAHEELESPCQSFHSSVVVKSAVGPGATAKELSSSVRELWEKASTETDQPFPGPIRDLLFSGSNSVEYCLHHFLELFPLIAKSFDDMYNADPKMRWRTT